MQKFIRQFNLSIMIILSLAYFSNFIILLIIASKYPDNNKFSDKSWFLLYEILLIVLHILIAIAIPLFGIRSVYFQNLSILNFYIIG